jgi:hypothetical protein
MSDEDIKRRLHDAIAQIQSLPPSSPDMGIVSSSCIAQATVFYIERYERANSETET